jgi:hypothetical protein
MDKKKQLKNIAFGGDWSEKTLADYEREVFLGKLRRAYQQSMTGELKDRELQEISTYIRENIEKGDLLAKSFEEKIRIKDPYQKKIALLKVINIIKLWLAIR